jgi:SAM-dependent methyltransferase
MTNKDERKDKGPKMDIAKESLVGKVVLEVGSGRGGTTRELVRLASKQPGATLIVTDLSNQHFQRLQDEFQDSGVQTKFICTSANELAGISGEAIDYLVCNYTLCAVNTQPGLAALALRRFWEVLKPGGRLFIEEEYPVDKVDTPRQEVWAQKWRLLKAATILTGGLPYNEIAPEVLADLCRLAGFEKVAWAADTSMYRGAKVLSFFLARLDGLLPEFANDDLRAGLTMSATELQKKAVHVGGMEVPYYRLTARKSA